MKYILTLLAAVLLTALALALYGQPLWIESTPHYVIVAVMAMIATMLARHLDPIIWWVAAAAALALGLYLHWAFPVHLAVALFASRLALLAPVGTTHNPHHAH